MKILQSFLLISLFIGCSNDNDEPSEPEIPVIETELIDYNYELDEENTTALWEYQVRLTNISDVDARGIPLVYHRQVGTDLVFLYQGPGEEPQCTTILAGEECIYSFSLSEEYEPGTIEPGYDLEFESAIYEFPNNNNIHFIP